jgi:TPR repeat protein
MACAFRAIFAASILVLSFGVPVAAGPFEDAGAALAGADYATTLRTMYEKGRGVAQDDVEAAKWYRLAANQGHAQAQFNRGVAYDNGRGVVQDEVLAHLWFNLSVAQGNQEAAKNRDIVARRMTPAQLAQAQKLAREWKPE